MLKTTWDGQPVTPDPPFGASVVVYRRTGDRLEFLVLHRALPGRGHGNWAWGSPAGARWPGEPIEQCARREALEETGGELECVPTRLGTDQWSVFYAEWPCEARVVLSAEHDSFTWVGEEDALRLCLPDFVGKAFRQVAALIESRAEGEAGRTEAS